MINERETPSILIAKRQGEYTGAMLFCNFLHRRQKAITGTRPNATISRRPACLDNKKLHTLVHNQERWNCKGYVIMPDHVHVVFLLGEKQTLSGVVSSFGKFTAKKLNEFLGKKWRMWQQGFYDHCLRDEESYLRHLRYIYYNPVRKRYVQNPEDWPFSAINPTW